MEAEHKVKKEVKSPIVGSRITAWGKPSKYIPFLTLI